MQTTSNPIPQQPCFILASRKAGQSATGSSQRPSLALPRHDPLWRDHRVYEHARGHRIRCSARPWLGERTAPRPSLDRKASELRRFVQAARAEQAPDPLKQRVDLTGYDLLQIVKSATAWAAHVHMPWELPRSAQVHTCLCGGGATAKWTINEQIAVERSVHCCPPPLLPFRRSQVASCTTGLRRQLG